MSTTTASLSSFEIPSRKVITKEDLALFLKSDICQSFVSFIGQLSDAVCGLKLSHPVHISEVVNHVLNMLTSIEDILNTTPPEENNNSRFGNPAFRLFYDRTQLKISEMLDVFIPNKDAIPEVSKYIEKCFGDRRRIDYGTGHEAHFICFLYCLCQLQLVSSNDFPALVLKVFARYLHLMRRVQSTYWLEPAGSHGVWGLDDYHSLPFLFGASQLKTHPFLKPKSIHSKDLIQDYASEYFYFHCIHVLHQTTSVSLRWHSPMLDDISAVKTWSKIEHGLRALYLDQVLGKLPIMQHFLFGSLISFTNPRSESITDQDLETASMDGHLHQYAMGQEFPTCCGLRLPSTHAANLKMNSASSTGLKSRKVLPVD